MSAYSIYIELCAGPQSIKCPGRHPSLAGTLSGGEEPDQGPVQENVTWSREETAERWESMNPEYLSSGKGLGWTKAWKWGLPLEEVSWSLSLSEYVCVCRFIVARVIVVGVFGFLFLWGVVIRLIAMVLPGPEYPSTWALLTSHWKDGRILCHWVITLAFKAYNKCG